MIAPSILNPYVLLATVAAALGIGAYGYQLGREEANEDHAVAIAAAVEKERAKFKEIVDDQSEIMRVAKRAADRAQLDARTDELHAGQLRLQLAAIKAKYSAATCPSLAAGDPIGVLADVLSRADTRARILATFADEAHAAGKACQLAYSAAEKRLNELQED